MSSPKKKGPAHKRRRPKRVMRKSCTGKVRHKEREGAEIARKKTNSPFLNVYKCEFCDGWHIGHRPKKHQSKVKAQTRRY